MEFTTIEECQYRINKMNECVKKIYELNDIQFDLNEGFNHSATHRIRSCVDNLQYCIEDLQESLNNYKLKVSQQD